MRSRRVVWIVIGVIAILVAIYLLAFWAFSSGDEVPGSGTGEIVTTPTP